MKESYREQLEKLATQLVTPQRFGQLALQETVSTVDGEYPDLAQAAIYYFPERTVPGDSAA